MRARTSPFPMIAVLALLVAASCSGSGGGAVFQVCGNGVVEGTEQCDDGDTVPCDGCSADCADESGPVCGDGTVNQACGEQCDDGNTDAGDGCDGNCMSEGCGNGVVDAGEDCDDGNIVSCDGCSDGCLDELPLVCGDGILNAICGEQCDDDNTDNCDGCTDSCEIEIGHVCGDGTLRPLCGEQCDDGNTDPGDGCDGNCLLETPPVAIEGEYSVDITVDTDECLLGAGPANAPMRVTELAAALFTVDIPVGGAGGECNPQDFGRQGDTLTYSRSSTQMVGTCEVLIDVTTVLTFFAGGSVSGFESTTLSEFGGDCTQLTLPCDVDLTLNGADCGNCFSCVAPATAPVPRGPGPLATGAGGRLDALTH